MKKAFTLIEFMILIAIIGILTCIMYPAVKAAKDNIHITIGHKNATNITNETNETNPPVETHTGDWVKIEESAIPIPTLSENDRALTAYDVTKMFELDGVTFYRANCFPSTSFRTMVFTITELQNGYGKVVSISSQK